MKMVAEKKKNGGAKFTLDDKKMEEIMEQESQLMIDTVFGEAVYLALVAQHGSGLLGYRARTNKENIKKMIEVMAPLAATIELQAVLSFPRVFGKLLRYCRHEIM